MRSLGQGVRAAVAFTLAQHGAFFASAWLLSTGLGAQPFGAWSQALALASVAAALAPLRLEYAGQLHARERRALRLFASARRMAWTAALAAAVLALAALAGGAPHWLAAGALAVGPLALLQIRATEQARAHRLASAAAARALPALLMVPLQLLACALERPAAAAWTVPAAAWLAWALLQRVRASVPGWDLRLLRAHWRFARAEWTGLALNTVANHGQVLAVGAVGGDAAAGAIALGLRAAMLPTSLLGLAWADDLRARVVAGAGRAAVAAALVRMALLSLPVHAALMALAPAVVPWLFAAQGQDLVWVVLALAPLGAVRLVASPVAFLPAWRGWLGTSVLLQALLCAAALGAAVAGYWWRGVVGVAVLYAAAASLVYAAYIALALRAVRPAA